MLLLSVDTVTAPEVTIHMSSIERKKEVGDLGLIGSTSTKTRTAGLRAVGRHVHANRNTTSTKRNTKHVQARRYVPRSGHISSQRLVQHAENLRAAFTKPGTVQQRRNKAILSPRTFSLAGSPQSMSYPISQNT